MADRLRGHNEHVAQPTSTLHRGEPDLYALLGVAPDASTDDITAAFRARAKDLHPDRAPDDAAAEEFKVLSEAYATLTRPDRRAAYDARRTADDAAPADPVAPPAARSHQVLPTRRRARWAVIGGIVCIALALAISPVLLSIETSSETLGRDVTLWIVVAKLLVCGAILAGAGWWRLATFDVARTRVPTRR